MNCPHCQHPLDLPLNKVTFKTECPSCKRDLHSCSSCRYHEKAKPNECSIPNTLFVRDRERYNFCEDFCLKEKKKVEKSSEPLQKLLGEKKLSKKSFDDLFK